MSNSKKKIKSSKKESSTGRQPRRNAKVWEKERERKKTTKEQLFFWGEFLRDLDAAAKEKKRGGQ